MTIRRTLNHNVAKTAATFDHAKATARTLRQTHERHLAVRDLFQVPTAISMVGLAMVLKGSGAITTLGGVNRITAGRALDLVDGVVARTCNQESDAGALADTVCDKLGMLAITHSALRAEALPKALPLAIFANNAASAALTTAAGIRHPHESYRPTKTGKYGMALSNIGVLGHLYASAMEHRAPRGNHHRTLRAISTGVAAVGIALSAASNIEYARRVK